MYIDTDIGIGTDIYIHFYIENLTSALSLCIFRLFSDV